MESPDIFQEKKKTDLPKVLRDWLTGINIEPSEILLDSRNGYLFLRFEHFRITMKIEDEKIFIRNIVSLVRDWTVTGLLFKLIISAKLNNIKFIFAEKVDKQNMEYWVRQHDFEPMENKPDLYYLNIEKLGDFYRKTLLKPEPFFLDVSEVDEIK